MCLPLAMGRRLWSGEALFPFVGMPVTQVENPMPDKEPDPILVWLQRPELGPIWAYFLLIVSAMISFRMEPVATSHAVTIYVLVVIYAPMHILCSMSLFLLPKRFPRFKHYVCLSLIHI